MELKERKSRVRWWGLPLAAAWVIVGTACNFTQFHAPTAETLSEFDRAGSVLPQANAGEFATGVKAGSGPYRIVEGDVLSVQVSPREGGGGGGEFTPVRSDVFQMGVPARVMPDGNIRLPFATEDIRVTGMTMAEAERAISAVYYPKYLRQVPLVFVQVREYQTEAVSISGGVSKPGRYEQRSDRMTLLSLLSEAGGLAQNGTPVIRITRQGDSDEKPRTILLSATRGYALGEDVKLEPGDTVEVETIPANTFTVIGLVNGPGRFEYPAGARINLIQAISYAGGINWIGDPRFARVYRRDHEGKLITADFKLSDGATPLGAATAMIKPGDVVALEQTKETAALLFLAKTIQAGLNIDVGMVYTLGQDVRFAGSGN